VTDGRLRSSLCVPSMALLIATRPFSFLPFTPALFGSGYEHMHEVLCRSCFRFRFTTLRLLLACCSHAHVTHTLTRLISSLHSTLPAAFTRVALARSRCKGYCQGVSRGRCVRDRRARRKGCRAVCAARARPHHSTRSSTAKQVMMGGFNNDASEGQLSRSDSENFAVLSLCLNAAG
jgi:hypothetical protein